ncbi:MAG TPA: hypothetical protein VIV58_31920, partial [Kofleriaceae bacterium]
GGGAFTWKLMTHEDPAPREDLRAVAGGVSIQGDIGPAVPELPAVEQGGISSDAFQRLDNAPLPPLSPQPIKQRAK